MNKSSTVAVYAHHCEIDIGVGSDHPAEVSPPISERNLELARSCHGVFGGDNDPIGAIHGGDIYSPRRAP